MIRISTRGRYALRAMVDLALHDHEAPVGRAGIAERQGVSADYVAQLFRTLRDAGLVESVKGPGGGYRLARSADQVTAGDVVRAVEGPVAVVHCALPHDDDPCNRVDRCVTHLLWQRLSNALEQVLDAVTLQDLGDESRLLEGPSLSLEGEA